jgi:hypothetical protein
MRSAILLLALQGCSVESSSGRANDLAVQRDLYPPSDLSTIWACVTSTCVADLGSSLCTSTSCATTPCTPGCAFVAPVAGMCPSDMTALIPSATAAACRGFCGFLPNQPDFGCMSFSTAANPACAYDCRLSGAAECYPISPQINYSTGGAICSSYQFCKSREPEDGGCRCDLASGQCF